MIQRPDDSGWDGVCGVAYGCGDHGRLPDVRGAAGGGRWSLGRTSISGWGRRSGPGLRSADDLLANNARCAESFDKGNLPLPAGPVLAALRPKPPQYTRRRADWWQPGWSPIAVAEDLRDRRGQRDEAQLVGDGQLNPGPDGPAQAHQHSVVPGLHEPVYRGGGGASARGSASSRRGLMRQEEVPHLAYRLGLHVRRLLPGICRHLGFRRQLR